MSQGALFPSLSGGDEIAIKTTSKTLRAINVYASDHGLKLAMSVPGSGKITYVNEHNAYIDVSRDAVIDHYKQHLKEKAKERARQRAQEKRR